MSSRIGNQIGTTSVCRNSGEIQWGAVPVSWVAARLTPGRDADREPSCLKTRKMDSETEARNGISHNLLGYSPGLEICERPDFIKPPVHIFSCDRLSKFFCD